MKTALIVLIVFLILLLLPFRLKVKIKFDMLNNEGQLILFFYFLKFLQSRFFIEFNKIVIVSKSGKRLEQQLFGLGESSKFIDNFIFLLVRGIKLKTLKFYGLVGYAEDTAITAMLCNLVLIPSSILMVKLSKHKPTTRYNSTILPSFHANELKFAFRSSVGINIFLILKCIIIAGIKALKGGINGTKAAH